MIKKIPIIIIMLFSNIIFSQTPTRQNFNRLIGIWSGEGTGFSAGKSQIETDIKFVMNKKYIEIKNKSKFEPTEKKPEGEIHEDWGLISFDKNRER